MSGLSARAARVVRAGRAGLNAACVVLGAACVVPSVSCGPPPPGVAGGIAPRRALAGSILRDDRVIIGRGSVIRAVGVARRFVYAVTSDAVLVYDRDRRAWLPPFTRDGGFDPSLVRAVAVDPDDDGAWLITAMGAWTLQPLTAFVTRAPAGPLPARLRASTLESVYREFPSLEAFGRLLSRDDRSLQSYPVISGARAPDRTEVWLGTAGGGLLQVDPLFNRAEPIVYGLAVSGAGAIARAADGVWIAPASRVAEPRLAITFTTSDLQRWRWIDDASRREFGGARATALVTGEGVLWMGTTRGLFRVPLDAGGARAFTTINGLPSEIVLSLLYRRERLWIGTASGLAQFHIDSADGGRQSVALVPAPRVPVRALFATGDTTWIGTDAGLFLAAPGDTDRLVPPAAASTQPRLRQSVRAIAGADSAVFVALADGVLAFSVRSGGWREPFAAVPWRTVGDIDALAADARTLWAGGPLGVLAIDRATGGSRILRTGSDLPDAVTGIVLDGPWAWIATLGGVVRVRRSSDGLVP